MVDLVILDCDGVLADTEPIAAGVLADMVRELERDLPGEVHAAMFTGAKLPQVFALLESQLGRSLPGSFLLDFRSRCAERFRTELQPIPGVVESLQSIGTRTCVASNGPPAKVSLIVEICGLARLITDGLHSAYDAQVWKPDPAFFTWVAARCGVTPERCLVVDDSTLGIEAAVGAGMPAVLFDPTSTLPLMHDRVRAMRCMTELPGLVHTTR
jgi:HAD superfamily hydrolase (TIGR01509 family)